MTWVISPRSVNEFRAGFNRMNYSSGVPEPIFNVNGAQTPLPYFNLTSYAPMGGVGGGASSTRDNTYQAYDNWSYQIGRHWIKAGAEFRFLEYVPITSPNGYGTYQFSSGQSALASATDGTGSPLASFLLGYSSTATRSLGGGRMDGHQPMFATYVQDQIRVTDKLTMNLGLRYEIAPPLYDTRGQTMGLDFSQVPSAQAIFARNQTGSTSRYSLSADNRVTRKVAPPRTRTISRRASVFPGRRRRGLSFAWARAFITALPISVPSHG
jgi:hypothetical protein